MSIQTLVRSNSLPEAFTQNRDIYIEGDFVVGDKVLGNVYNVAGDLRLVVNQGEIGNLVKLIKANESALPRPKTSPVRLLPRSFDDAVGRITETSQIHRILSQGKIVQIFGRAGIGKTSVGSLLAHESYDFSDGLIYCDMHTATPSDVLQYIFDGFFEASDFKPSDIQIRDALKDKAALVVIDHLVLSKADIQYIINSLPTFTFLFLNDKRSLYGDGKAVKLKGLQIEEGVTLFQENVDRTLSVQELNRTRRLVIRLEGHPGDILKAAELVNEDNLPIAALLERANPATFSTFAADQATAKLGATAEDVLELLAAFEGAPLHQNHIEEVAGIENASEVLARLEVRKLIDQAGRDRNFSISSGLASYHSDSQAEWMGKALTYFGNWIERYKWNIGGQQRVIEALLKTIEWGFESGPLIEAINLVQKTSGMLVLAKRWGIWHLLLEQTLSAAQEIGNQAAAAWAYHQMGTHAMVTQNFAAARSLLTEALKTRRRLGDGPGSIITEYHLRLLRGMPPLGKWPVPKGLSSIGLTTIIAVAAILMLVGSGAHALWTQPTPPIPLVLAEVPTNTATPSMTPTATETATSTLMPIPTSTATEDPTITPTRTEEREADRKVGLTFSYSMGEWAADVDGGETASTLMTLSARGGIAPYTYFLNGVQQNGLTFNIVAPICQLYSPLLVVQSADGQTSSFRPTFNMPCVPLKVENITVTWANKLEGRSYQGVLAAQADEPVQGHLTMNVSGGDGDYSFLVNGEDFDSLPIPISADCTTELYLLDVEVKSGDGQVMSRNLELESPCDTQGHDPLDFTVSIVWADEVEDTGGYYPTIRATILISATGGDGNYSYFLGDQKQEGPNFEISEPACTLEPSYLEFQVTSGDDQAKTKFETPTAPCPRPKLEVAVEVSWVLMPVSAAFNNPRVIGAFTIAATGGDEAYRFYLNGEEIESAKFSLEADLCQNEPISFTVKVTSGDGQVVEKNVSEKVPCPPDFGVYISSKLDSQDNNWAVVRVSMEAYRGSGGYEYFHNGEQQDGPIFNLNVPACQAINGSLTVKDSAGQSVTKPYTYEDVACAQIELRYDVRVEYQHGTVVVSILNLIGGDGSYIVTVSDFEPIDDFTFRRGVEFCNPSMTIAVQVTSNGKTVPKTVSPICPATPEVTIQLTVPIITVVPPVIGGQSDAEVPLETPTP